jgi:hypothetical protein
MSNPYNRVSASRRPASRKPQPKQAAQAPRRKVRARNRFASRKEEAMFDGQGEFNPESYDYGTVRRAASTNTDKRRMFNAKGEINANSKKDALTQAYHLLRTASSNATFLNRNDEAERGMSREARREVLAAALQDPEGFRVVGQELALPIKDILDYEGFARKIFRQRKLAQAELFRVPLDIRSVAWVIGQDGKSPRSVIKTKWIVPDETKITSFPVIDISDIYQMNFDVLDRAQDTARQEIELAEDKRAIALIDAASTTINATTTYASLGVAAFEDVRYQVERHRLMVEQFLINRAEMSDVIKNMSSAVDPVTERELLLSGYIGNFLNARILTAAGTAQQEVIPAGTFYACTGPDYLGEMATRIELFSEPFNEYNNMRTNKGWAFIEAIGFVVPNAKTVARGVK